MSEKSTGDRSESYQLPTTSSSLDSNMFIGLTSGTANPDIHGGNMNAENEEEDEATNDDFASGLHEYDSLPFSAQLGFDFEMHEHAFIDHHEAVIQSEALVPSNRNGQRVEPAARLPSAVAPTSTSVPEFLYQLTKMLTENNNDVIEWSHGRSIYCKSAVRKQWCGRILISILHCLFYLSSRRTY